MALGKNIKRLREAQEWSQDLLSEKTGHKVSQETISQLERRDSKSTKFANELAKALGVSVDLLLSEVDELRIITPATPKQLVNKTSHEINEKQPVYQAIAPTLNNATLLTISALDQNTRDDLQKLIHCYLLQDQQHKDLTLLIAESYLSKEQHDKYSQQMDALLSDKDNNNADSPDAGTRTTR